MNLEILVELMVFGMHEDRYRNRDMHGCVVSMHT